MKLVTNWSIASGSSPSSDFDGPTEDEFEEDEVKEPQKQPPWWMDEEPDRCPYCGTVYADDGGSNCPKCGAPR